MRRHVVVVAVVVVAVVCAIVQPGRCNRSRVECFLPQNWDRVPIIKPWLLPLQGKEGC